MYLRLCGSEFDGIDRAIDLRVSRLRKKLGDNAKQPFLIKSVRHVGYLLVAPMNRLFVRLYVLLLSVVLLTTFATVLTVVYARWQHDVRISEGALRGGALLAAQQVMETPEPQRLGLLERLAATFGHPVSLRGLSEGEMSDAARARIVAGDVVLIGPDFDRLAVRVGDEATRLEIGPFAGYSLPGWELFLIVFLFALLGGALLVRLLRRLHRQLNLVRERMTVFAAV